MNNKAWKKLGNIFRPEAMFPWLQSHAANPTAEHIRDDIFRIYFSGRDKYNRSSIGYFVVNINNPAEILEVSSQPVVVPGDLGTFDDSGASVGCIVHHNGKSYLYYLGWNLGVTVPWRNSIGLAIADSDEVYRKISNAPVLDRSHIDPYSVSYPFVLVEDGIWKMWYGSNLSWGKEQKDMHHLLKYAESTDGIHWNPTGEIAVKFKDENEYAISKPSIIKVNGIYKMWYSYRGDSYRIGYAESENGIHFRRMDECAGIDVSQSGWDSESIEYPYVIEHGGAQFMFYNGNKYGLTGIGLAVRE